jgi:hypothetical protein
MPVQNYAGRFVKQHCVLSMEVLVRKKILVNSVELRSSVPRIFFGAGEVQQIKQRTEGRQNGDLGAVAPS